MAENIADQQFRRIHHMIEEGMIDEALAALEQIQPQDEEEEHEIAYLRAWCYSEQSNWVEAAHYLPDAGVSEKMISDIQALGQTERRRRAHYQLLLGNVAINTEHFDEAMRHYQRCIKFLDERRMNIPDVRIKALQGLGTVSTATGFYDVALKYYLEALRLCEGNAEHPTLPHIYYGLCNTYRHKGDFLLALDYGQKALQMYTDQKDQNLIGRIRNQLGRTCFLMRDFQMASTYFTEALALATLMGNQTMSIINLTALADLRLEEGEVSEAWRYCEMALQYAAIKQRPGTDRFLGMLYIVCGKVREAEAKKAAAWKAEEIWKEAISFYSRAIETLKPTNVRAVLSEAYQRLAQALEASGKQDQAILSWKLAYEVSGGRPIGLA